MAAVASGSSNLVSISGTTPGALDATQSARLLSTPESKLAFATFHPRTASQNPRKLSKGDELCSNKRVVIEVLSTGESFWRWVPRAKGGGDEGEWPRVVDICGQNVMCSQDQWDLYKLDPVYDCTVHPAPLLSTITRSVTTNGQTAMGDHSSSQTGPKRAFVEDDSDEDLRMPGNLKKSRPTPTAWTKAKDKSDDEVEMMVDNDADLYAKIQHRTKTRGPRKRRRLDPYSVEYYENNTGDLSMIDLTIEEDPTPCSIPVTESRSPSYTSKPSSFTPHPPVNTSNLSSGNGTRQASGSQDPACSPFHSHPKRRAGSPTAHQPFKRARRAGTEFTQVMSQQERKRQGRYNDRVKMSREARDAVFTESLRASVPPDAFEHVKPNFEPPDQPASLQPEPIPEEDPISLEEKIRRIQELNAYEQARREHNEARLKAEAAEAEQRRKQEESRRRERERAERERLERELEQERRRKQQQEDEAQQRRKHQEDQERKRRQQQEARYLNGPWTTQRALERYKSLAEAFDNAKFTAEDPITFTAVPWPVLLKPTRFSVEDVDWASVEAFFHAARAHMRAADFKIFIEKSHRRFHPDRWRARRVLQSVEDEELRACLEVAANTVAQAITPIWRDLKNQ